MFANLLGIRPIWHVAFDKIVKGSFYTHDGKRDANYMYGVGKSFGYYEDNLIQLVEIKCLKQSSSMGIILSKNDDEFDFDETKIKFYISHLKDVVLDEIKIPTFKQELKMRYNSILKATGLNTVFAKIVAPDFFPETAVLHDVVQNVSIVVDNIYGKQHELNRGYRTSRKFLATKPFIYYFRLTDTNTILLVGSYC
jgi:serine protease inhibitor